MLAPMASGQSVETLGIADVVMTILEARKTNPRATAAAVSRESCGDVIQVRVSLLESAGDRRISQAGVTSSRPSPYASSVPIWPRRSARRM